MGSSGEVVRIWFSDGISVNMDQEIIESVNKNIYLQFPEVKGTRPKVHKQGKTSKNSDDSSTYLLVYSGKVTISENRSMPRVIRVVVNENGKVLKISTSK